MGPAALERVVAGKYEWRDEGMRAIRGVRKRYWEEIQTTASEDDDKQRNKRQTIGQQNVPRALQGQLPEGAEKMPPQNNRPKPNAKFARHHYAQLDQER